MNFVLVKRMESFWRSLQEILLLSGDFYQNTKDGCVKESGLSMLSLLGMDCYPLLCCLQCK